MNTSQLTRRSFIRDGSLFLAAVGSTPATLAAHGNSGERPLRFGLVTDLHHADKPPGGTRHYRETLNKFTVAAETFQSDPPDHIVELGDIIDAADSVATELAYLKRINKEFASLPGKKHYVLGNHCVDTLSKEEFLGQIGREQSFYSFNARGFHFVILDACFRTDGVPYQRRNFQWTDSNIPPHELEWLQADLEQAGKTVVFAHQRLDVSDNHGIRNSPSVRTVLEQSGKVLAVFQGHSHKNDHKQISAIHYVTLAAMIEGSGPENNAFSTVNFHEDGCIHIHGFIQQQSYQWS